MGSFLQYKYELLLLATARMDLIKEKTPDSKNTHSMIPFIDN